MQPLLEMYNGTSFSVLSQITSKEETKEKKGHRLDLKFTTGKGFALQLRDSPVELDLFQGFYLFLGTPRKLTVASVSVAQFS